MDRLSIFLTLMTGSVIAGVVVITAFTLGYYSWIAIAVCLAVTLLLSWPVAFAISRRIKREDPTWHESRLKRTDFMPRPNDPEV